MKKMFPGYYLPSEEDFESLWKEGLFVFDTNVLLNMYSYPDSVRDVFESVLRKIQDRIWIPFYVGLEFQYNRFNRVSQYESDVKKLLDKIQNTAKELSKEVEAIELEKRTIELGDIQDRLNAVRDSHLGLSEAVELAYRKVPLISLNDDIAERICGLFENRVGLAVENQGELDKMLSDAVVRYTNSIPPGFRDIKKEDTYFWGGVAYPQKYGDLIIWKQTIDHALNHGIKNIIFVTDDRKEDWWLQIKGKNLGPHPILVEEIGRVANVEQFWMYSADKFLEHAERHLSATEVTRETIEKVASVGIINEASNVNKSVKGGICVYEDPVFLERCKELDFQDGMSEVLKSDLCQIVSRTVDTSIAVAAVRDWVKTAFVVDKFVVDNKFPDITALIGSKLFGFCVKWIRKFELGLLPVGASSVALKGLLEINHGRLHEFVLIVVLDEREYRKYYELNLEGRVVEEASLLVAKYKLHSIVYGMISDSVFQDFLVVQ
ncbi:MAG TPA: PIN-like domain-containing protein [Solidesulfovibrio magneticus]|nr:PIN-like domain-containing protein [Solidesulfovibrio magneticus]